MEDMASLWCYQEPMDEMRQKLLYTSLELEKLKVETSEEMRKNKEYVDRLIQLLNTACQERDEARDQLQKLLNKIDSPVKATKANSSITVSNSLSETNNYQSHNSSPVDSFFDSVSSPELSNKNIADSNAVVYVIHENSVPQTTPKVDHASMFIDSLVKGKTLPQQGKLLQTVLEAGPLLQTLLVSGQLPRWRNPPQLKPFNIPPVSIKGCEVEFANQNLGANLNYPGSRPLHSQVSCGSSQMLSIPMLNFANSASVSCLGNQRFISPDANMNNFVHLNKRQRLQ